MRLFWQEMKKIWRPGVLAAIVLIGAMFYKLRPDFYREHFGGDYAIYQMSVEWAEKYGPTMEQSERDELDAQLAEEKETFSQLIANIPEAVEAGLTDYDSYVDFCRNDDRDHNTGIIDPYVYTEDYRQRWDFIWYIWRNTNCERIEDLERFMSSYDLAIEEPTSSWEYFLSTSTPQEQARVLELKAMDQRDYLPSPLYSATVNYFRYLATWNIMGVILLLSPTLVRDRLRRVRSTQWSSRTGRGVLNTQIMAGLASSLLFSMISAAVYSALFLANGVLLFKDFPIYGIYSSCWFDMTYGQYVLALVGLALLAGLITGALTLFFSNYSGNYVAMLLKAVPLLVVLWVAISNLESCIFFFHRTYLFNGELVLYWPKGLEFVLYALLLALGLGLCAWTCARQKKKELL